MENNQYQPYQQYKPWPKLETENTSNFQPVQQQQRVQNPIPNPIPTPHPIPPIFPKKKKFFNWKVIIYFLIGLFFGIIFIVLILHYSNYVEYSSQNLVKQASITAYNNGALFVINYTLSTGNIPFISSEGTQLVSIKDLANNPKLNSDLLEKLNK